MKHLQELLISVAVIVSAVSFQVSFASDGDSIGATCSICTKCKQPSKIAGSWISCEDVNQNPEIATAFMEACRAEKLHLHGCGEGRTDVEKTEGKLTCSNTCGDPDIQASPSPSPSPSPKASSGNGSSDDTSTCAFWNRTQGCCSAGFCENSPSAAGMNDGAFNWQLPPEKSCHAADLHTASGATGPGPIPELPPLSSLTPGACPSGAFYFSRTKLEPPTWSDPVPRTWKICSHLDSCCKPGWVFIAGSCQPYDTRDHR